MDREMSDEQQVIDRQREVVERIEECLGPQSDNEIQSELNAARLAGLNREYERLERLLEDVRDSD